MRLPVVVVLFISWLLLPALSTSPGYSAIFSFGNSYADTGNVAILGPSASLFVASAHPPYGETFFGHPTGRCSDGRVVVDFIAEELGLPFLPPFHAGNASFAQGANFAVSGATTLGRDFFKKINVGLPELNISLGFQLAWFEALKPTLCKTPQECGEYLGKSLFLVGEFGTNDYHFPLTMGRRSSAEVMLFVPTVVDSIAAAIERLISHGAATLVVPGLWPLGCSPMILTVKQSSNKEDYDPKTGCLIEYNRLARYHNGLLRETVLRLRSNYPNATIILADYYRPVVEFIRSPSSFGFGDDVLGACCGGGGQYNFNRTHGCGLPGVAACEKPSTYANWDGVHLTEAAYRHIAAGWLKGPYASPTLLSALRSIQPVSISSTVGDAVGTN